MTNMAKQRRCTKCAVIKRLDQFDNAKKGKYGKKSVCKECCRLIQVEFRKRTNYDAVWRKENRERTKLSYRKYFLRHREQEKLRSRTKNRRFRASFPEKSRELDRKFSKTLKGRIIIYKKGAKSRGLEFSLSPQECEVLFNSPCFYCGIDGKDGTKGYFKSNVVPCCKKCNFMKGTQSDLEFIKRCKKIAKIHGVVFDVD